MSTIISRVLPLAALVLAPAGTAWAQGGPVLSPGQSAAEAPQRAVCAVCGIREKSGPEPVAATQVYQGKSYYFCTERCRAEFQLDPARWITAAQMAEGREGVTRPPAGQEHEHAPGGAGPAERGSAAPS